MKILCPTDFSAASLNAIEYAAQFAQATKSSLMLLHVQPVTVSEGVNYFSGGEHIALVEMNASEKKMKEICSRYQSAYQVQCDFESIAAGSNGIEKAVADESAKFDLTIIGTNGADTLSQFYFGSHSFRVAKKQSGPVLIIPEECGYRQILNVAFASDCHLGDTVLLKQLKNFTDTFNPQIRVVHISEKDSALSREVYKSFCNLTEEVLNYDQRITFERIIHENKAAAIENFVNRTQADVLALYMEDHSLPYRIFHKSIVKKLTSYVSFPILVFHK